MKDFYKEHLVKQRFKESDRKKKLWFIGGDIALALFIWQMCTTLAHKNENLFEAFILLALILIGVMIYFTRQLILQLHKEYEYTYTEDILDIDVIKNKSVRKRVYSGCVAEFEIVAHIDDKEHLKRYSKLPVVDYGSGEKKDNTYVFVASYKGKRKQFVFEPTPEMLDALYVDLTPRRMFKKK
jgi:hypothetical protein